MTTSATLFAERLNKAASATEAMLDTLLSPRPLAGEIERPARLLEAMRYASMQITPRAMLSRAQAGIRANSLIVNLPGSPKGAVENLEAVLPSLGHGLEMLSGRPADCAKLADK